jgi:REP element-mobilizing transposase RayT
MGNSHICVHIHFVFAVKNGAPVLCPDIAVKLWGYIGGIAKTKKVIPQAVGGVEDHVHALMTLPATITVAQTANLIKGASSRWLSKTFTELESFKWQQGYGAMSVSPDRLPAVRRYINRQPEHHGRLGFKEEMLVFSEGASFLKPRRGAGIKPGRLRPGDDGGGRP